MKSDLLELRDTQPASSTAQTSAAATLSASTTAASVPASNTAFNKSGSRLVQLMQRVAPLHKAALSIFDQAIYSGTSFLTAVIVGRATTQSELGVYYLSLTIVLVLYGIHDNAVSGPYAIYSARRQGRALAEYTGSMWAHHAVLTLLGMAAIGVMIAVAGTVGNPEFVPVLAVLLAAAPLLLLREGIRRYAFARLHPAAAIDVDAVVSALQLVGLLTLWQFNMASVPAIFAVMGGACAVAALGWLLRTTDRPLFDRQHIWADWLFNWKFARWAVLSWLTVDTVPFIMPWIVDASAGAAATGLFGACATLVGVNNILVVGTGNFLRPKSAQAFAHGGVAALRRLLVLTGLLFLTVFGLFTAGMAVAGEHLAMFVYGDSFAGSTPLLTALAANLLVCSLGFIGATGLWAIGRPRASMFADLCLAVSTLAAALLLVGPYGALGVALASLVGSIIGAIAKLGTLEWLLHHIAQDAAHAVLPQGDRS